MGDIVLTTTAAPIIEAILQASPEAAEGLASFRERRRPAWYVPDTGG